MPHDRSDRTYYRNHERVVRKRGSASKQMCSEGNDHQAREWAQIHETTGEDPFNHFKPMCNRHHQQYDKKWNEEERRKVSDSMKAVWASNPERRKFTEEHKEKLREARRRRALRESS